jgi:hypothetical protein
MSGANHLQTNHAAGIGQASVAVGCIVAPEFCLFLQGSFNASQIAVLYAEHGGLTKRFWLDAVCGVAKNEFVNRFGGRLLGYQGAHETLLAKNLTKQFGGFVTAVSEFLSSPGCQINEPK